MTIIAPLEKYYHYLLDKELRTKEWAPKFFSKHMTPYIFICDKIRGKLGLEIGCNNGYGTYYLSHFAKRIVGTDIDIISISLGQKTLPAGKLDLLGMNGTTLGFKDNSFDFIISSQTIEHIPLNLLENFVYEAARVLKPNGIFYVCTHNLEYHLKRPNYLQQQSKAHIKEFMKADLHDLLNKVFKKVAVLGVRANLKHRIYRRMKKVGIIKWSPKRFNFVAKFYNHCNEDDFIVTPKAQHQWQDLLAICQK